MDPDGPIKPLWTSATFLQYVGAVLAFASSLWLLTVLEEDHGTWGLLAWSAIGLMVFASFAVVAQQRGEAIVAGLLAVVAVMLFGVVVGSFVDLVGLEPDESDSPFFTEGLPVGLLIIEIAVLAAAQWALRRFRFPLLVLIISAVAWYAVMDLLEGLVGGGDTATAFLALVVGLVYVLVGSAMDVGAQHPYAMWVHVVGGLSIGGAVLTWWHEHTWEWLLVLVVSLLFIATARALGRSSYAVIGAVGLLGTATYFVEKWFSLGTLVPFFEPETEDVEEWGRPLVYLAVAGVFIVLGLLVERRRVVEPPPPPPDEQEVRLAA